MSSLSIFLAHIDSVELELVWHQPSALQAQFADEVSCAMGTVPTGSEPQLVVALGPDFLDDIVLSTANAIQTSPNQEDYNSSDKEDVSDVFGVSTDLEDWDDQVDFEKCRAPNEGDEDEEDDEEDDEEEDEWTQNICYWNWCLYTCNFALKFSLIISIICRPRKSRAKRNFSMWTLFMNSKQ